MAHPVTIITDDCPEELDGCGMRSTTTDYNGKVLITMCKKRDLGSFDSPELNYFMFSKHDIVSGKTELFEWSDGIRGRIVNIYSIGDDLIVVLTHERSTNRLTQHMVQFWQPKQHPSIVPWCQTREEWSGWAHTICTRTQTLLGRCSFCSVSVAMGRVYSGLLLVNIKEYSTRDPPRAAACLIASNPLHIDRYPDVDLSKMVMELDRLATEKALQLLAEPVLTRTGIFYGLWTQPLDNNVPSRIVTHLIGAIHFLEKNKYKTELIPFGNEEIVEKPEYISLRNEIGFVQSEGIGYLVLRCPDDDRLKSRRWWEKKRNAVKMFFCNTTLSLFDCLDSCVQLNWCDELANRTYKWHSRLCDASAPPTKGLVYAMDFEHMKFRAIPFEEHTKCFDRRYSIYAKAAPNGALFIASMPCNHMDDSDAKTPLIVTLLWEPTSPPSLKEIAQRRVMQLTPEYRTAEYRKRYGLLDYDEEIRRRDSREDISMATSYSLMDVKSGFRMENGFRKHGGRRSTSTTSILDSTQSPYSSCLSIDEKSECGGAQMVLSIVE